MPNLKLRKHVLFSGTITCKTALRIGGSKEEVEPGGLDNPVIRDPVSKLPYVPGSSLKGKLRSLLEYYEGRLGQDGKPCGCGKCDVCRVFGAHFNLNHDLGPPRLLVRDAMLSAESQKLAESIEREGGIYAEIKQEVIIDRRTGVAARGGLRTMERVPAGAKFDLHLSLRIFEGDDETKLAAFVKKGLDAITNEGMGGGSSRGSGWCLIEYKVSDGA